ncbi:hypothetical protein KAU33_04235 [Candidatus Dependentiae bacterium]|nr:hypothetical protein [Candidatus Dependentiae bacterium]
MIEKRNPDVEWDSNKPWDEDLNKLHAILMDMLDHQESVTGEELWFKFIKKTDYRNGYFVYLIEKFFTTLDTIQIEEPEPAEFIFRIRKT